MNEGKGMSQWMMDRRSFLKTTGVGIVGSSVLGATPFLSFTRDEAEAAAKEGKETVIPTFCDMCGPSQRCGVYAFVKDGRFIKVGGMKEAPTSQGALCAKGHSAPQWVYSRDRLKVPLKRVGEKGEGKFEKITWNEAIGTIASRLKEQKEKYGPETLAILSPAYRSYYPYFLRFLAAHGSPNYCHSGICAMQMMFTFSYTYAMNASPEFDKSDLIVYWGSQPVYAGPPLQNAKSFIKAKGRGTKIIAIKPSVEPDSGMADIWVPVRPGTDAALALGMLHVVVNEGLIDRTFVNQWCYGYDQLKERVQEYPPEWAEKVSGVPAKQIREVARMYATTPKACISIGNGLEHAHASNDSIRAVCILIAITGHLDREGGNVFPTMGGGGIRTNSLELRGARTQEMVDKLIAPEFPRALQPFMFGSHAAYYGALESILTEKPYLLRTVIAPGTQPLVSTRQPKKVVEALKKLDFFVVVDVARTADMDYADIVMPVATSYEIDHPFEGGGIGGGGWLMARNRVIEPVGSPKSIFEFFLDLGVATGYGDQFWNGSMTDCMNYQLEPMKMTIDDLRKHPTGIKSGSISEPRYEKYESVFKIPSPRLSGAPYLPQGKVAIYNTTFEEIGFNPLPEWREPPESITGTPELIKRYPLILSDYHTSKVYTSSMQRNVPNLREVIPFPALHIHPDTASERGIENDDWIIVESPHGWMKVRAEIYPGIRPDTVMILHGWWQGCKELGFGDFPLFDGGANVNIMYSVDPEKAFDPVITACASQTLVQVRKAVA
jgi:anaerobic selenocysteine-containing dehydrogenase